MSSLIFLIAFVVLSIIGGFVLWFRERSPRSMESDMRAFKRQREALSPDSWTDDTPTEASGPRRPTTAFGPRRPSTAFGPRRPRRRRPNAEPRSKDPRTG